MPPRARCYARRVPGPIEPLDEATVSALRAPVLAWYELARRDFPWRGIRDPYAVLVSEVMLQQTQAARVGSRFVSFMRQFPTPGALASATTADVLAEWSGLGYYRRALALQRAAARVAGAGWPRDVSGLQRLPGVGPYTARAIASLAFGEPVGVVDTNVRRWLLRRFGGADHAARLQSLADALARPGSADDVPAWTHATMELGARVCRPRAPLCGECPLSSSCPSRGAAPYVPVHRQAALRGSDRAYRGAVVRALAATPSRRLSERRLRASVATDDRLGPRLDDEAWSRIVDALRRDGLVHRAHGMVALGAATIRP
jgi:A/G-specific adenine glycosylase